MSPMNNRLLVPRKTPGLLDLVPGAAAAYSLRSLSRSYADPVVTVRRSSDDAEDSFTASEVADGTLAAFAGAGDAFVKQWWDQSGNARHASQSTANYQPSVVSAGSVRLLDGKPAIYFSSNMLSFQGIVGVNQASIFILANNTKPTSLDGGAGCWLGYSLSPHLYLQHTQTDFKFAYASLLTTPITDVTSATLGSFVGNASTKAAYTNGALGGTGGAVSFSADKIGSYAQYTGGPYTAYGMMQELIIYPSDLTAQRELIEGNIAWSYSV